METITITKRGKGLKGTIRLPSSKSISNRLLIIRALSSADFPVENLSDSDDTLLLIELLKTISERQGEASMTELNTANAGTVMRFLTAYLSMVPGKWILTGSERMKQRPIGILVDGLRSMGARIDYLARLGYPPVMIHGTTLKGKEIIVDPGISSQFVSALMLIGPKIPGGLIIHLSGQAVSFPYVNMTIGLLKDFGVHVRHERSRIIIPESDYIPCSCKVESDWSAAAFWYEAAALSDHADITLEGLQEKSLQGDSVITAIFRIFNVTSEFTDRGVHLSKSTGPLKDEILKLNFSDHPDIAPPVMTACALTGMHGSFSGLKSLQIKETDRLTALKNEYEKIGIMAETYTTGNLIPAVEIPCSNPTFPPGLLINTYGDHRMAMTFAPMAILSGSLLIENPGVVTKSYPGFWNDLASLGFKIRIHE
ncbi:MAG: 3-phosphoshikimate 1-carboxyvinyltransferase [Bacteroidetes bacterium]|nr:3-phosphoshikimate 1-carboxyvinyltransferase [Bacteroidota bacterium]